MRFDCTGNCNGCEIQVLGGLIEVYKLDLIELDNINVLIVLRDVFNNVYLIKYLCTLCSVFFLQDLCLFPVFILKSITFYIFGG